MSFIGRALGEQSVMSGHEAALIGMNAGLLAGRAVYAQLLIQYHLPRPRAEYALR